MGNMFKAISIKTQQGKPETQREMQSERDTIRRESCLHVSGSRVGCRRDPLDGIELEEDAKRLQTNCADPSQI